MIWPNWKKRVRRKMSRTIGLNARGRPYPEVYRVCDDVYRIVEKMLGANKTIGPFSRDSRFEFEEVAFIVGLLGAHVGEADADDYSVVDLWIRDG